MTRRDFIEKNAHLTMGLGLLAITYANCASLQPGKEQENPADLPQFKVRPPVLNPLPNVYMSLALEVVYVIKCGGRSVLVDSGFHHNLDSHLANFKTAGIDMNTIDAIFATHCHVDHTGGLSLAKKRLKCPVFAHKNSVDVIQSGDKAATAAEMPYIGWKFQYPPCKIDEVVEDGDEVALGDTTFRVIHLPGHTPDSTGYFWENKLLSGDALFSLGGLGWSDVHWGSNFDDAIETMHRLTELNPEYLLPTHGAPFRFDKLIGRKGEENARDMLEGNRAGAVKFTKRAPLARAGRTPRKILGRG